MRAKVNMLFSSIPVKDVCDLLEINTFYDDDGMLCFVDEPNNASYFVLKEEFVLRTKSTSASCGNIVDLVVMYKGLNYYDALSFIVKYFDTRIPEKLHEFLKSEKTEVSDYLEDLYYLNNKLKEHKEDTQKLKMFKSFLESVNLLKHGSPVFVIPITGSELLNLLSNLKSKEFKNNINKKLKINADLNYIIYPYYANYHSIASLHIQELYASDQYRLYESTFSHGYLGYSSILPNLQTAFIFTELVDFINFATAYSNHGKTNYGFVLVSNTIRKNRRLKDYKCGGIVFTDKIRRGLISLSELKSLRSCMKYFSYAQELRYYKNFLYQKYITCGCCRSAIVSGFFRFLKRQPKSQFIRRYLNFAFKDKIIQSELVNKLIDTGNTELIRIIDVLLGSQKTVRVFEKLVKYTDHGYLLEDHKSSRLLTNFILILTRRCYNNLSGEIYYEAKFVMNSKTINIDIPYNLLRTGGYKLTMFLTKCSLRSSFINLGLPVIYEDRNRKFVKAIIHQQITSLNYTANDTLLEVNN